MRRHFTVLLSLFLLMPLSAFAGQKEDDRANDASRVLSEILRIPEDSIPSKLLSEAQAIAVIPDVVKAGFVIGGRRGKGLIAVRGSDAPVDAQTTLMSRNQRERLARGEETVDPPPPSAT